MTQTQKGSILALFMALSVIITTGAAGLLVVSGAWESDRVNTLERRTLLHGAESGLLMGASWMRRQVTNTNYDDYLVDADVEKPITPGGYVSMNGAMVKVTYVYRAAPNTLFLISRATMPNCLQTLQIEWQIMDRPPNPPTSVGGFDMWNLPLTNWTESIVNCDYTP